MPHHEQRVEIAVVGGGPVGMCIAAELALAGRRVTVIETRTQVDERPRAGTVHARSLSHLARRGYIPSRRADEIVSGADRVVTTPFQFAAQPVLTISAPAVEPAPIAGIPQARLEAAFEQRARALGATILRGHTVSDLRVHDDGAELDVTPDRLDADTTVLRADWVVGADGARGIVARHGDFGATTYPATMNAIAGLAVVGDPAPPPGWFPTDGGWTLHNPNSSGAARVIALDFSGPLADRSTPDESEFRARVASILGRDPGLSQISHLTRFSDFGRHRTRMRDDRLVVVGDAAHVHYPLGGQGLNTGMQDAFTLGWRLAQVIRGGLDVDVLDEWSRSRVAVAGTVVANTVLQARMMNPADTATRDAMLAMLAVPRVHDAVAEMISGQFQPGFQTDLVVETGSGDTYTLADLLRAGRPVAIVPDDTVEPPTHLPDTRVIVGKVTPEQPWVAAVIAPDGYLAAAV
ncbi:FAD-dependent monooxygenase [Williamsia deligens]|uniref:FAD-dependent monooxygenase n=1 Tax=Williamsia deligens TaxID=321325 RepID=A0ABW3GBJ5_9NOCA|nr:FAD-dependent monooxygenase [Williamsia deligens]MCP2192938.1 2-polyprenyl-6-methoxyphenol hydroxylase [Williamsia deligens]